MLLLDTAPLVDFLNGLSMALKPILEQAESTGTALAASAVTIAELFYILVRFKGADFARGCLRDLGLDLETIPVDAAIAEETGSLKHRYAGSGKKGLPLADAIIAPTALRTGAELVTNDPHFEKIEGLGLRTV